MGLLDRLNRLESQQAAALEPPFRFAICQRADGEACEHPEDEHWTFRIDKANVGHNDDDDPEGD